MDVIKSMLQEQQNLLMTELKQQNTIIENLQDKIDAQQSTNDKIILRLETLENTRKKTTENPVVQGM